MAEFIEFDIIRDPVDKVVVAVLTYKVMNNGEKLFSYSFMREFEINGQLKRTCWLNRHHLPGCDRLIPIVRDRLSVEEEKARYEARSYDSTWKAGTVSGEIDTDK